MKVEEQKMKIEQVLQDNFNEWDEGDENLKYEVSEEQHKINEERKRYGTFQEKDEVHYEVNNNEILNYWKNDISEEQQKINKERTTKINEERERNETLQDEVKKVSKNNDLLKYWKCENLKNDVREDEDKIFYYDKRIESIDS